MYRRSVKLTSFKCEIPALITRFVGNKMLHLFFSGFECRPGQQVRGLHRGTHPRVSAGSQHMRTIHIPKSAMSAPFLQVTWVRVKGHFKTSKMWEREKWHFKRLPKEKMHGMLILCMFGMQYKCVRLGLTGKMRLGSVSPAVWWSSNCGSFY